MFKTTALDSVANEYVDKDVGESVPGTRIEADDQNIKQDELVAPVESSGQSLDATGVKRNQVARAMFLNGVGSQSMVDSGTANAKVLTPVTGASGYIFGETYAQLTGAVFLFKNLVTNTGAVTIDCGQTAGTLIGVKSFTKAGGVAFAASELVADEYYEAIYDLTNDRFELPINSIISDIPSGEKILFYKNTAVLGYSLLDTLDDKVVYVTKGSVAGGQTGGTVHSSGSWTIGGLTVDAHEHAFIHKHAVPRDGWGTGGTDIAGRNLVSDGSDASQKASGNVDTVSQDSNSTDDATSNSITHAPSWRPAAYNFTMQERN